MPANLDFYDHEFDRVEENNSKWIDFEAENSGESLLF